MESGKSKAPIDIASERLRRIALGKRDGEFIGSEDDLLVMLEVARVTARQAARLLEREGLVRVRRGANGGYFAARPNAEMIETVVCGYLNTLGLERRHTGGVATALWIETMREAAASDREKATALAERLGERISRVDDDATMTEIGKLEQEVREEIFGLIGGGYLRLLLRINATFSRQHVEDRPADTQLENHVRFVRAWRRAKLMELNAIADGDPALAMLAAQHTRNLWTERDPSVHKELVRD